MSSVVTIFTVHMPSGGADRSVQLVPHRFCWPAFLFGPFWLAANRLWVAVALVLAADIAVLAAAQARVLDRGAALVVLGLVALLVGLDGREWARAALLRRGSALRGVAFGDTETEALAWAATRQPVPESQS
jgi:hypothetical protein